MCCNKLYIKKLIGRRLFNTYLDVRIVSPVYLHLLFCLCLDTSFVLIGGLGMIIPNNQCNFDGWRLLHFNHDRHILLEAIFYAYMKH